MKIGFVGQRPGLKNVCFGTKGSLNMKQVARRIFEHRVRRTYELKNIGWLNMRFVERKVVGQRVG